MVVEREHVWKEVNRESYAVTWRTKVPGGWLYRYSFPADESDGYGQCMVFVPSRETKPTP